jgi:hypothetical protein
MATVDAPPQREKKAKALKEQIGEEKKKVLAAPKPGGTNFLNNATKLFLYSSSWWVSTGSFANLLLS